MLGAQVILLVFAYTCMLSFSCLLRFAGADPEFLENRVQMCKGGGDGGVRFADFVSFFLNIP